MDKRTEIVKIEQPMKVWIFLIIILSLAGVFIYLNFFWIQESDLDTFADCKLNLWRSCNLPIYENTTLMCYKIKGQNSTKPNYCIEVNESVDSCWKWGYYTDCVDPFSKFLECLGNESELVMSSGCSHCEEQIKILNDYVYSFEHRSYIMYFKVTDLLKLNETEKRSYEEIILIPTWIINGTKYSGVKTIKELSEIKGCELKS